MEHLQLWPQLANREEYLCAVQAAVVDRNYVLGQFRAWGEQKRLPLYFWNLSCRGKLWQVEGHSTAVTLKESRLCMPDIESNAIEQKLSNLLLYLGQISESGIFVMQGVLENLSLTLQHHLEMLHFQLRQQNLSKFMILLEERVEVPLAVHPLIPQLEFPLPSRTEVRQQVARFFGERFDEELRDENLAGPPRVTQACIGLPRAEIDIILNRLASDRDDEAIALEIVEYKQRKLQGRGITVLPDPDVPVAAGMDKLDETMEQIKLLMTPEAEQRGLKPPKAVLLWGIPGTGKSLAAKLAAKRIGGPLVASDWNGLIGQNVRESLTNLNYLLAFVRRIGPSILFFDEFDKAFSGWDESGHMGKLAARLLSWMNDHSEPCVMFATINHLGMLPPEMIRRFEVIHFFGMPHNGALHAVFEVHLQKYFEYDFSMDEWHYLLREYRGCTPAEVMKAVKAVAHSRLFKDIQAGNKISPFEKPELTLAELLEERQNFIPDSSKRDISDTIAGILNKADYAKPVQGEDTSIFAEPPQTLMGLDESKISKKSDRRKNTTSQPLINRPLPAVEDI